MIQIEKAPFQKRLLAFLIDLCILCLIQSVILLLVIFSSKSVSLERLIWANVIATLINLLIYLVKDLPKGISIGKKLMKIAVRDTEDYGKVPDFFRLIVRNIFVLIWPIEFFILILRKDRKRLGDKVAKTEVVNVKEG